MLGFVGADVLHRAAEEPAEERNELRLAVGERVRLSADEGDHADAFWADEKRRGEPATQAERHEVRLLGVLLLGHVLPVDDLPALRHFEQEGPRCRPARSGRKDRLGRGAGRRDHAGDAVVGEDDRRPVEWNQPAELADERAKRLLDLER